MDPAEKEKAGAWLLFGLSTSQSAYVRPGWLSALGGDLLILLRGSFRGRLASGCSLLVFVLLFLLLLLCSPIKTCHYGVITPAQVSMVTPEWGLPWQQLTADMWLHPAWGDFCSASPTFRGTRGEAELTERWRCVQDLYITTCRRLPAAAVHQ